MAFADSYLTTTSAALLYEQKRIKHSERFASALGGVAAVQFLLSLWYADYELSILFGSLVLISSVICQFYEKLSSKAMYRVANGLNLASILFIQVLMPADPAGIVLLVAFGLSCFATCKETKEALFSFGLVLLARYSLPLLGLPVGIPSSVPMIVSFTGSMLAIGLMVVIAVRASSQDYWTSRQMLLETEASLLHEKQLTTSRSEELQKAALVLEREMSELTLKLAEEESLRSALVDKQLDERQLVHAIDHDLREPLRSIISFGQLLRRKLSKEPDFNRVEDYLNFAIDGGHRMTQMLGDLLEYAQSDLDQPHAEIDLNTIAESVCLDVVDLIQRSEARVEIGPLPVVHGYDAPFRQLLLNLLNNALKFSRPGVPPVVRIYSEELEDGIAIHVADNGIGIPANQIDHVFGLFNRAHDKADYAGSGVGLALCRRVAIAHGAKLTVSSVLSEGSTFTLKLAPHLIVAQTSPVSQKKQFAAV
ncbi:MAG: ATP-binding protein [Saprospiraceae bacterium]